ncbi:MAG: type III pantothenate kinase [Saprospiraceae bacterium]
MNLCIDIGNSRTKFGIFEDDKLITVYNDIDELSVDYTNDDFNSVIISSVKKEIPEIIFDFTKAVSLVVVLDFNTILPIKINYDTPETLGMDRVAAAVGANYLFPNENCIVIDAGTCITMDFISSENEFLGGNISPGIYTRIRAMHRF